MHALQGVVVVVLMVVLHVHCTYWTVKYRIQGTGSDVTRM